MAASKPTGNDVQAPEVYGAGSLDYHEYLKVQELLKLQVPQSKPAHHDEYLFIIIHQAFELWFKLVIHEMETTLSYMRDGNVARADHFLKRIIRVTRLFIEQIHILETMTPAEFLEFRDHLKPASGFQSVQFREIEYLAGLRETAYLKFFKNRPELLARLEKRLAGPDLGGAFLDLLRSKGYKVPPGLRAETLETDAKAAEAVRAAIASVYNQPARDPPMYQLAESMIELDETFSLWRHHHVNVVERIIGAKVGTGGSSGVSYLRTTTSKRFFPFLWDARTHLG